MNHRHPLAIVAGLATLLATIPLASVFVTLSWLVYCGIAITAVVGAAMLTRAARGPVWTQVLAMMAALLLILTVFFPSGQEFLGFLPTVHTFMNFNDLFVQAGTQIRTETVPVPDQDGLLLLTVAGIGLVAVLVDMFAVGMRRPALAGLPMLAIYSVPVAVLPDGISVIPFLLAGSGYLWLLVSDSVDRVRRFGRRFTGEGRDVDVWEPSPMAAAGRRLGLVGLVLAMLIPLAVPGLSTGLLDALRNPGGKGSGPGGDGGASGTTVDLNAFLTDQLLVRDHVTNMVRLTTTDPNPYYLRFGVADTIDKNGFVTRAPSGVAIDDIPGYGFSEREGVTGEGYKAQIEVLPDFTMPLAPTYQQVYRVHGLNNDWFYDGETNEIFARDATIASKQYSVDFIRVGYTPEALRGAPPLTANEHQLVSVPQVDRITDLVSGLINGKPTEYDRVRAIYDFFTLPANNFTYSVVAPVSRTANPIVDFLDARKGFCVQYAAAMAWLVRVAGYPARVAFGFTRGAGPNASGLYTLTNFNLHAWTEVYFPLFGWVPFDSTPAGAVSGSVQSAWAPDPSKQVQNLPDPSPNAAPGPAETEDPSKVTKPLGDGQDGASGSVLPVSPWVLVVVAIVTLVIAVAITPALRRRSLTRRRRARSARLIVLDTGGAGLPPPAEQVTDPADIGPARRDAHEAWAELYDTMLDFGVDVDDAETPRTTAERLASILATDRFGFPISRGTAAGARATGGTAGGVAAGSMAGGANGRPSGEPGGGVALATRPPAVNANREHTRLLARAEERARYARAPVRPDGLNEAVTAVRDALTERATRWQRLSATFMPRSVLLRWRLAIVTRFASMVAATAKARGALGSASPRRALARPPR